MELAQGTSVQHSKSSHRVSTSLFFLQWQHPCCLNAHFWTSSSTLQIADESGHLENEVIFPFFKPIVKINLIINVEETGFSSCLVQIAQGGVFIPSLFPCVSEEHRKCYPEGCVIGKLELELSEHKIEILLLAQGGRGAAGLRVNVFTLIIKLMKAIASDKMCLSRLYLIYLSYI